MINRKDLLNKMNNIEWFFNKTTAKLNSTSNITKLIFDVSKKYLEVIDLTGCYRSVIVTLEHFEYIEFMKQINLSTIIIIENEVN